MTDSFAINRLVKKHRQVITAVIITAFVVGGGTYFITKNSATTVVLTPEEIAGARGGNPKSGDEVSGPPDVSLCKDYDADGEEGGIYIWGEAISFRPGVPPSKGADACASDTVLNEVQCVPGEKDGESVLRAAAIECPGGCRDGVCVKIAAATDLKIFAFTGPSPLSWDQNGAQLAITGVELGDVPAPAGLLRLDGGDSYAAGEKIHALSLTMRITAPASPDCLRVTPRRLLNEEGDLLAPNTRSFAFPDGNGCIPRANVAYTDQTILFVVPEGEREFALTTGSGSDLFFTVRLLDGNLLVEYAAEEG